MEFMAHENVRILLVTPPIIDPQTAYPATAYLTGFLTSRNIESAQADVALELLLRLFSQTGFLRMKAALTNSTNPGALHFLRHFDHYSNCVELVTKYLQTRNPFLSLKLTNPNFFPPSPRGADAWVAETTHAYNKLRQILGADAMGDLVQRHRIEIKDPLAISFGALGLEDRARYLASQFIVDLVYFVRESIDPDFNMARYAEQLAASASDFTPLENRLAQTTLVDTITEEIVDELVLKHKPNLVGVTAPFPGNVYGALRVAQTIKRKYPNIKLVLGGGYINTELRSLTDTRVFNYFDFITFDDGEKPLLCLIEHLEGKRPRSQLFRTMVKEDDKVVLITDFKEHDIPHKSTGTPSYRGLRLERYMAVMDYQNILRRLWSHGHWNKLTLAHGCYWRKCTFCDINLDYVGRYDPVGVDLIVQRINELVAETGRTGFHFVDEACPPAVLKALSSRILELKMDVTWWGNVRFDKAFTAETANLMGRAGCVAVTGGLEVASNRILKLMQKGTTVEQVAKVGKAFSDAGILVHAYLIYGFPTQTTQETVDALEVVRQLFVEGCLKTGFWHRFVATPFSPVGREPDRFDIELLPERPGGFARFALPYREKNNTTDHDKLGPGLVAAVSNYAQQAGFDKPAHEWFKGVDVPCTTIPCDFIKNALASNDSAAPVANAAPTPQSQVLHASP